MAGWPRCLASRARGTRAPWTAERSRASLGLMGGSGAAAFGLGIDGCRVGLAHASSRKPRRGFRATRRIPYRALRRATSRTPLGIHRSPPPNHIGCPPLVKGGSTYRIITDHLGSVRLVVDATTGTIVQEMEYDEFGRVLSRYAILGSSPSASRAASTTPTPGS